MEAWTDGVDMRMGGENYTFITIFNNAFFIIVKHVFQLLFTLRKLLLPFQNLYICDEALLVLFVQWSRK